MAREQWRGFPLVMRLAAILLLAVFLFAIYWFRVAPINPDLSRLELAIAACLSLFAATAIVVYFDRE